jgi:acetylornithine aminotransferase
MQTYKRAPVDLVRGEGMTLYDAEGKAYLDFLAGIGCVSVGYSNPAVVTAIQDQAARLGHTSNLFHNELRGEVAECLNRMLNTLPAEDAVLGWDDREADLSGRVKTQDAGAHWRSFFANSGAEANECAIKLARKYGKEQLGGAHLVVSLKRSFHGRTLATLAATGQPALQADFLDEQERDAAFLSVPFGDLEALEQLVCDRARGNVCAVMLECIQGEGGVWPSSVAYLQGLREFCDVQGILLIIDEVQTGFYRSGSYPMSYAHAGILPDVVTMAKGIANGFPCAACAARDRFGEVLQGGDHGSTFGGNLLAMSAARATLGQMQELGLALKVSPVGVYLQSGLAQLAHVSAVRGSGLMVGAQLDCEVAPAVVSRMLEAGFILNATSAEVLRFLPPLICTRENCDAMLAQLQTVLEKL